MEIIHQILSIENMKKAFTILIVTIITFSCTEEIEIQLGTTYDRLVVFAELTSDTTIQTVSLHRSSDFFNPQTPVGISNADVRIFCEGDSVIFYENDTLPGIYQTSFPMSVAIGKIFQLQIKNVDINEDGIFEEYVAESVINTDGHVDSIKLRKWPQFNAVSIRLWAQDPPSIDYYLIRVKKNGLLLSDSLREWIITDDLFFNGNNTNGIDIYWLNQRSEDEKIHLNDTIELEISAIPQDYYKFISECSDVSRFQTPLFSSTPGNVRSNISNGAVGFFAVTVVRRAQYIVTENDLLLK
ncbi:MAG TPA: DUF4249 family protein [Salinivirgaceae bacterium]|nr:DUF4249 family protein [Salinivirgaceae bacterium]